jgi:predicted outer membrane repeat protein
VDNVTFSDADPDQTVSWYVDGSMPGSGDGRSRTSAFKTIQEGIDAASCRDLVTVATGTYLENIYIKGKNIDLRSTNPFDPDIVENTIIDGNQAGSVVTFARTENETCALSGFTIRNGGNTKYGGGIDGGRYWQVTRAAIRNNTITENSAEQGGGVIYCHGVIEDNLITSNTAEYEAGGVSYCDGPILRNVITHNAGSEGGLCECNGLIADNTISWNSARNDGGGLYYAEGIIWRNVITDNTAGGSGGGLSCCYDAYIANNEISRNVASGDGGGLSECNGIIQSNLIVGNSADYGGGLYYCGGTIINNTIVGNRADKDNDPPADDMGGGLHECDGTIENCIIWDNVPDQLNECAMPTYCRIWVWTEGGEGNESTDPSFVSLPTGNYRLRAGSRCIDMGTSPYPIRPGLDMDGNLRIALKTSGLQPVDIGAYEYDSYPFEITRFVLQPNGKRNIAWTTQPNDHYTIWWRKHTDQKGWWELATVTTDSYGHPLYYLDETWVSPDRNALLYRVEMNWPVQEAP